MASPGLGGTIKRRGRVAPKSKTMIQVLIIQFDFLNNPLEMKDGCRDGVGVGRKGVWDVEVLEWRLRFEQMV